MRPLLRLGKSPMTELSAHEEAAGLEEPLEDAMAHFARTTMIELRSHAAAHIGSLQEATRTRRLSKTRTSAAGFRRAS